MFGLFGNKRSSECPVNDLTRVWLEQSMLWLLEAFGEEAIKSRRILTPEYQDFPIAYNGQPGSAIETMKVIATQMEISPNEIIIDFYNEGIREVNAGTGHNIYMKAEEGEKFSGGLYWGKKEDDKYHISLNENKLKEPLDMIATLAHEMCHIKLLGESRITENNEGLTDLSTVIFGMGIFNANAAFQTKNGIGYTGWSRLGYLSQMEWGYALALLSYIQQDEDIPYWARYLTRNVKADMEQGLRYIYENEDKVMRSEE